MIHLPKAAGKEIKARHTLQRHQIRRL